MQILARRQAEGPGTSSATPILDWDPSGCVLVTATCWRAPHPGGDPTKIIDGSSFPYHVQAN
jgi:hypothetical protein